MNYPDPVIGAADGSPRLSWSVALTIVGLSVMAMYCMAVSLHTIDVGTGSVAATESLKQYREALGGNRDFPYQWRLLGIYLVYAGERLTGLDPHALDIVVKTALLSTSSTLLFLFSRFYASEIGAICAVAVYLLLTVAGFSDQYTIYFTNDFAVVACWFGAVYCVRTGRAPQVALLTFAGAWAKETMLLVPVLLAFRALRTRSAVGPVVLCGAAFLVPTAILRTVYRAPLANWAWWRMLYANVPFLQSSLYELELTIKNNVKVALFYNALWVLAARRAIRGNDPFLTDLAMTGVVYLLLAYPVIYIRELRHFLPLAIVVLPLAIAEIEAHGAAAVSTRP